ncbi:MAG: hypothetical protein DBY20_03900 [Coriobacteriia bacterium]|nr:MAG: hypothetical protein DBY20_03900 [Coriobacteriia bacterium]
MALEIEKRSNGGVLVSYHRIMQLDIETNVGVSAWVRSYVDASERQRELDGGDGIYHEDVRYSTEGMESAPLTVEEAYAWLKTERPEFADAEDC